MTQLNRKHTPTFHGISKFKSIVSEKVLLDNNIPVYVLNAGTQDVIKTDIIFNAGVWYQPKSLVATFTAAMLTEGTSSKTSLEISEKLDYYGAYLQPTPELDNSVVSLVSLNRFSDKTFDILSDLVQNSIFPANEFEVLKTKRKQAFVLDLQKTNFLAKRKYQELVFGSNSPYSSIRKIEDFDNLKIEDLTQFYNQFYNPDNCKIIISGRTNDAIIQSINKFFGNNSWQGTTETNYNAIQSFPSPEKAFVEKKDAMQSSIRIGKQLFNKTHPDYKKLKFVNTILGGYFGSRLMSNIREDKGYTYGIGSVLVSLKNTGYFVIVCEVGTDVTKNAIKEIYFEIERLRNEKINAEELNRVRNYLLGDMLKLFDGPFSLSDTFGSVLDFGLDFSYYEEVYDTINSITPDDILEMAQKYLDPSTMFEVVAGKM